MPIASGIDHGRMGWAEEAPMARLREAISSGVLGSSTPFSLRVKGKKVLKKPALHESGHKRSMAPVALVQATTA